MFCAISGTAPEEPVVSSKSGHLFERRLILKAIKDTGVCPVTGESLAEDDLLEIKPGKGVKPRPSPATSIPGLLGLFHNEWDALMLETHTLRQSLNTVRQELSHALYQHDAACRVIARLIRERDDARSALEAAKAGTPADMANGKRGQDEEMEEAPAKRAKAGITPDVAEVMAATSAALSKGRKKRLVPESLAKPEEVGGYGLLASQPLHKTTQGGILALDLSPAGDGLVATAGADGTVKLFDRGAGRVLQSLTGHGKKVKDVKFMGEPGALLSCGTDKACRLWRAEGDGGFKCAAVYSDHTDDVVAVTVHPSHKYFITASADRTWCFYDAAEGLCLSQVADPAVEGAYTCAALHPDGLILGTGTDEKLVRIWEVKSQKNVAKFEGHAGPVTSISFSENGYYLATSAADGIKLWDLRKLRNFKSLTPYDSAPTAAVSFDSSGLYLAAAGADARVYGVKQDWGVVKAWGDMPKKGAYALKWGPDARALYVGASDHNLRIYGAE